jgi:hypothetical protein
MVVILAPFLIAGRLGDLLTFPITVGSVMPVATANAHNLWWMVLAWRGLDPLFTPDSTRFLGPLSYRVMATLLLGAHFLFVGWLYWSSRARLAEVAALTVLGWFAFTTQAHENHLFFLLPLLALAWPSRPGLLLVYGVLTLAILLNLVLHDLLIVEGLGLTITSSPLPLLRSVNAALIVGTFVAWAGWTIFRAPDSHPHRPVSMPA